ncbi:MAG: hemerythrin family protein [Alphaproteobacteria bacterium]|nr:hemerythrin family protein [Alphaproteobacteria bacterium]
MSLRSLKDGLKTGIDGLDYEHRELVGLMESLCDSFDRNDPAQKVAEGFGALYAGASAHFALEESLMREKKYAGYDDHKADHERLLDQIRGMNEAFEAGRCADCGMTLRDCLEGWLTGHVKGADAQLYALVEQPAAHS